MEFQRLSQLSGRLRKECLSAEKEKEERGHEDTELIQFKKDTGNPHAGRFETFISNRHLKLSNRDGTSTRYFTFNHLESLPARSKYYFKIREVETFRRNIILGLGCNRSLQYSDSHLNVGFLGYHLG